ncbi:hypothetical protein Bca52824_022740 [Brassica carinata]|uniref:Uncharacterized protein n=1 Tax=Brassica carinata TaxID=52824 RepID=A0A8X8ATP6_BRACI|nr:hypothetical protein Bca52824_022740 [Brassica carinata]
MNDPAIPASGPSRDPEVVTDSAFLDSDNTRSRLKVFVVPALTGLLRVESLAGDSKRDGIVGDNIPECRTRRKTGREDTTTFFCMKKRKKNQRARLTVQIFGIVFK